MKVKRINLSRLRNEEWFNFFTEFKKFVESISARILNIEKLFGVFLFLYAIADEIIEKIRKSKMTPQIFTLDKRRDNTFRGLIHTIGADKFHFDSAKSAAAKNLEPLLTHYGNLADKPYNEETSGIYNFIQEFRTNYSAEIETLELNTWLDELKKDNDAFEEAILERNKEISGRSEVRLLDVRRDIDNCYREMIQRIEASMLILEEDAEKYEPFVKMLNANIKRYLDAVAQRKGRADAKDEYDEED
jgi:hypothetical protein